MAAAVLLLFQPRALANVDTLILMYNDLEPYVYQEEGELTGFIYHYLNSVAKEAGVPIKWENVPWEKQIHLLKQGNARNCSTGLYKTEERSHFLKFSEPIGLDTGYVVVGLKEQNRLNQHDSFLALTKDQTLRLLLQTDASYGNYIDKILAAVDHTRSPTSTLRILYSILNEKYDYTVMTSFMGYQFLRKYDPGHRLAIFGHYTDLVSGEAYYLGCSLLVGDTSIERLNKAIIAKGVASQ